MKSGRIKAHVGQECWGINTNPWKCQHTSFKVFDTKKKPITKENKIIGLARKSRGKWCRHCGNQGTWGEFKDWTGDELG